MLHIKLRGMKRTAILRPYTPTRPFRRGRTIKTFLSENGNFTTTCKQAFCPFTHPRSLGYVQMSKAFLSKVAMLQIILKGIRCGTESKYTV